MPTNIYMFFVAALIPLLIGSIYYHPKVAGSAWMKTNNFTEESLKGANMAVIFGLTYVFSVLLSFVLSGLVIHQSSIAGLLYPESMDQSSEIYQQFKQLMTDFGDRHRTFSHGAVHGIILTLFFILPIVGINALFERRGWKYILIHTGYWLISLALMGGLLCQTLHYEM